MAQSSGQGPTPSERRRLDLPVPRRMARRRLVYTDPDGTRRRRTVSGKTQADVRRTLAGLRADLDRGLTPPERTTVAEFLAGWLEASRQRIRHSTWRGYESCVRVYLVPASAGWSSASWHPADVERMTASMIASGLSPRTAALTRVVLRRALGDALRDGLVHRNVAALARPPHVPSRSLEAGRDYLGTDDLRRLLLAAKVHPMGPLVTVAATTGLRLGELLGLAWSRRRREGRNADRSPLPGTGSGRLGAGRAEDQAIAAGRSTSRPRRWPRSSGSASYRTPPAMPWATRGRTATTSCSRTAWGGRFAARGSTTRSTTSPRGRAAVRAVPRLAALARRRRCWARASRSWSCRGTWAHDHQRHRRPLLPASRRSSSGRPPTRWTRRWAVRRERPARRARPRRPRGAGRCDA